MIVDKNNRNGQFLLTGSVNLRTMPSVTESLAGRVRNIRLRPLTVGEVLKTKPKFFRQAFNTDFPTFIRGYDKRAIFDLAFRGGYPEAVRTKKFNERREWHKDYIKPIMSALTENQNFMRRIPDL